MKSLIELLAIPFEYAPFLASLIILTAIILVLAKSIKKHKRVYYIITSIPAFLYIIQAIVLLTGSSFSFYEVPVIGEIMEIYAHMVYFGFPLLVIIMFIGALDAKNKNVKKLLVIRKELSIISGFPVLTHSLIRIIYTLPGGLQYFLNHTNYVQQNDWVKSDLGVGISSFGYVLGIAMVIVFLILWITSFESIHRRLGNQKWKKIQRWAYVLYAMLFIHSITLHVGWMINWGIGMQDNDYVVKELIAIISTVVVFSVYLFLRLRKK